MALSNLDRELLDKCLAKDSAAWQEFTDRFLALIVHVVNHTAAARNIQITADSRDDLVAEVFLSWIDKDFAPLRRFRGNSSLATYLTVIARRVIVRRLSQLRIPTPHNNAVSELPNARPFANSPDPIDFQAALEKLSPNEATALRMFHLDGCSYQEIGSRIGMPENSVGPLLSRARDKMKNLV
ncbi:MAG: sigma-70 family RNA polymerase sigma factor [Pirellula sp.]|nr:sigma-70 family RNA polymerase sigma factor [Pirellula sp.]